MIVLYFSIKTPFLFLVKGNGQANEEIKDQFRNHFYGIPTLLLKLQVVAMICKMLVLRQIELFR